MSLFYRFIFFIITVLFMFASLILAIYGFGLTRNSFLPDIVISLYNQWQIGLIFLIAFIAGAWVIYPFFTKKENRTTLITQTELGEVDITLAAVDNLVKGIVVQQEGIEEINTKLRASDSGLHIFLTGKVHPGIPIPDLTVDLQNIVKSYIEDTTGVKVKEVRVLVDGISNEKKIRVEEGWYDYG